MSRRARRHDPRGAVLLAVALLAGCDADGFGFDGGDGLPVFPDPDMGDFGRPDMGDLGPVDCPSGELFDGVDCVTVPDDPCVLTDQLLGAGCVDADGDCFPDKCDDAVPAQLLDCDDMNAERRPGLAERCDGFDNDCDGAVDEGLDLGGLCEACGRRGVLECRLDGGVACSVEAGQSEAQALDEACDGADQDCDGVIDEACLIELSPGERRTPRWCADRLLWIADGALVAHALDSGETVVLDEGPVATPTCDAERDAWLRTMGCDGGGVGAPFSCAGAQLMARVDGAVLRLSPFGTLGAPTLGADGVYLHEGVEAPVVLRAPLDGQPADVIANDVSDPTAPFDGLLVARALRGEQRVMEGVGIDRPSRTLDAPGQAPPGRPVRDADLIAWVAGESPVLWVLPAANLGQGVQVGPALDDVPWITPGAVWWRAPDGLRRFDARTGQTALIDASPPASDQGWVGTEGRVALVEGGVRLWPTDPGRFAPADEDAGPPPDAGMPDDMDAGVGDAGVGDAGLGDAGIADAGLDAAMPDAAPDATPDATPDAVADDPAPPDGGP